MKTRDIFGLAIRLLGLIFLYHGLHSLPVAVAQSFLALLRMPASVNDGSIISTPFMGLWPLVVALWFFYGAPPLMRIAYPNSGHEAKEDVTKQDSFGRRRSAEAIYG